MIPKFIYDRKPTGATIRPNNFTDDGPYSGSYESFEIDLDFGWKLVKFDRKSEKLRRLSERERKFYANKRLSET